MVLHYLMAPIGNWGSLPAIFSLCLGCLARLAV
jgi:hypothetical protein